MKMKTEQNSEGEELQCCMNQETVQTDHNRSERCILSKNKRNLVFMKLDPSPPKDLEVKFDADTAEKSPGLLRALEVKAEMAIVEKSSLVQDICDCYCKCEGVPEPSEVKVEKDVAENSAYLFLRKQANCDTDSEMKRMKSSAVPAPDINTADDVAEEEVQSSTPEYTLPVLGPSSEVMDDDEKDNMTDNHRKMAPRSETQSVQQKGKKLKHPKTHSASKSYTCPVCSACYVQSYHLTRHLRKHSGERPYACEQCDETFQQAELLTIHRRRHTGEKPYVCKLCGDAFIQTGHLHGHMQRKHSGASGSKERKLYACEVCGDKFTHSNSLKVHMRRHTGQRPFSCGACKATFTRSNSLTKHIRRKRCFPKET